MSQVVTFPTTAVASDLLGLGSGLGLGLGLGLVSGSSFVGVCRHLAAVVSVVCRHDGRVRNIHDRRVNDGRVYSGLWSIHDGRVRSMQARRSCA